MTTFNYLFLHRDSKSYIYITITLKISKNGVHTFFKIITLVFDSSLAMEVIL